MNGYRCIACNTGQGADYDGFVCPSCGGNLDLRYDYDAVASELAGGFDGKANGLFRYRALLPVTAGGTLTEEKMQQEAAKRADALRTLYRQRGQMEDAAWSEMRSKLEEQLRERQFFLAQSMSAAA